MNVFDLSATLTLDTREYQAGLSDAEQKAYNLGSKIGGGLKTAAAVGTAAITAAAGAVSMLTKQAVANYGEYQQLVGGVETLFGESADVVQGYAERAFQTAGLSANQYMETVTSFSASLLQSLNGDTAKAAELGNVAITDMADNANKMGTSMESIQNAYQGFAKQNYTMLDNLKLGYGGTKSEMERLIQEANRLREIQGLNADLTIDSYADIVEAIHTVQTEMGISGLTAEEAAAMVEAGVLTEEEAYERLGTTAKEASGTITGSMSAVKGAWQNLLTGLARPDADLGKLIDDVVDNAVVAFGNLLPAVEQALTGIGRLVEKIGPVIAEKLPGIINDVLPSLLASAYSLVNSIVANLPTIIQSIVDAVVTMLPILIQGGIQLIAGVVAALPEIIAALIAAIPDILKAIVEGFSPIIEQLGELFGLAWEAIKGVFAPIGEWFSERKEDVQNAFAAVDSWFDDKFQAARDFVHAAWEAIGSWFSDRWNDISTAFAAADSWFDQKFQSARDLVHSAWSAIGSWFSDRWSDIQNAFAETKSWFETTFEDAKEGVKTKWSDIGTFFTDKWTEIKNVFSDAWSIFKGIGGDIVRGLIAGITEWISSAIETARSLIRRVKGAASDEAGVASPSKVFMKIGQFLDEGLAKGIALFTKTPVASAREMIDKVIHGADLDTSSILANTVTGSSGVSFRGSSDSEPSQPIILQVLLDGKVIGETSYNYMKRRTRMVGA